MHRWGNRRLSVGLGAFAGAVALGVTGYLALPATAASPSQTGLLSTAPVTGTPSLTSTTSQKIYQLVQCGSTMYGVGDVTSLTQGGIQYARTDVFSFSATAPYAMTTWAPDVTGSVNTIAFAEGNCSEAYIGGKFSEVDGTAVQNIAEISTTTGAVNTAFAHSANNEVSTIAATGTHLLVGGPFTEINGISGSHGAFYTSLNYETGLYDNYLYLDIWGHYSYSGVVNNYTGVYNQQISPNGQYALAEGIFMNVGGKIRQQIFMLTLGTTSGVVNGWYAPLYNQYCEDDEPWYARDAAWSPDSADVYVASTGRHDYNWGGSYPFSTSPCDAAVAFSAATTAQHQNPLWSEYTGCDSLYSIGATADGVYAAGHPQYADNAYDCKGEGKGAIPDQGLQGFNASTGSVLLDPAGTAGMYSMSRANADDMLLTSEGMWIASGNRFNSNVCDGVKGLAGICLLPYPTS
jgi:hypothetical protein